MIFEHFLWIYQKILGKSLRLKNINKCIVKENFSIFFNFDFERFVSHSDVSKHKKWSFRYSCISRKTQRVFWWFQREQKLINSFKFPSGRTLTFPNNLCYLFHWKPFKKDGKCFLFHLKSSFCSEDIQVFVMTFWSWRKNGLIKKIRIIQNSWRHNLINKQLQYLMK